MRKGFKEPLGEFMENEKKTNWYQESFIVEGWHSILSFLEKISLFYFIRTYLANLTNAKGEFIFKRWNDFVKENYFIVDFWVVFNNVLALIFVFLSQVSVPIWLKYILLIYGATRVFEIFIYQMNVIFVHPYKKSFVKYALCSYRRMTIMLIHNFFEIICWFAGTYMLLKFMQDPNASIALNLSFLQMITYNVNIAGEKPNLLPRIILQLQAIIGVFMTVLSFARFTSLLPKPHTMDELEKEEQADTDFKELNQKIDTLQEEIKQLKKDKF